MNASTMLRLHRTPAACRGALRAYKSHLYSRRQLLRSAVPAAIGRSQPTHSPITNSLISVLKDELKFERESYRKDEDLLKDPPNGFVMYDPPNKNQFYLQKEHKNEEIVIEVDIDNQPKPEDSDEDEDGDDDIEDVLPVQFRVQINKDDNCMIFNCESTGDFVVINHLALESADKDDDPDETPYSGPVFDELDDTLQQAFLDYLEERGINAELGEYIRLWALDKMAVEYQNWLQKVRDFVSQ